MVLIKAS
jgi:hypothetical protein